MITSVTGTTSSTVVTLSSSADSTAVTTASIARMPAGLASTFFADQMARYSNTPHFRVIETMIIIPTSRPMVLKSMPVDRLLLGEDAERDHQHRAQQRDDARG